MNLTLNKTICGNTISNRPEQSLLIGLTFTIPQPGLTDKEVVKYIQDNYFDNDNISPSGFFRLMPMSRCFELASLDYLRLEGEFKTPNFPFSTCITHKAEQTVAEVLFGQLSFDSTYLEELECTRRELQSAIDEGIFTAIVQNDLCLIQPLSVIERENKQ